MATIRQTVETITPQRAFQLLDQNTNNRNIRQSVIDRYAREMKAGRWELNGEPIIISDKGRILNGQHRLWAIIEADVEVQTAVAYGIDEDTFDTIDTGAIRSAADIFKIGEVKDPGLASQTVFWIWRYTNERIMSKHFCTAKKALELFSECPEIEEGYTAGRRCSRFIPKGLGSALFYMFSLVDHDGAEAFFEAMATGDFQTGQSAIRAVREGIINTMLKDPKRLTPEERCAMIIKAWNAFQSGRDIRVIRFSKKEKFPAIEGLDIKLLKIFRDPQVALKRPGQSKKAAGRKAS